MSGAQTFVEHLVELRVRIIRSLYGILLTAGACYYFSDFIFDLVAQPIRPYLPKEGLVFNGVMDAFMAHLQLSLFAGVIVSSPYWFFHLWKFLAPGLYLNERKFALIFIFSAVCLFATGFLICYFGIMPMTLKILLSYGRSGETTVTPLITLGLYLSFFMTMNLVFGLSFELPLILVMLGMFGVISQKFLKDKRRYAMVLIALFAGICTPSPDAISMLFLMVPLMALYEISILLVGFFERKRLAERSNQDNQG